MELLFNQLKTFCLAHINSNNTCWIAYSGGLDSHVLLHLAANLRDQYNFTLRAVHVNHGLSPHADRWAAHCLAVCHDLHIELIQQTLTLERMSGDSLEETARDARYAIFAELLAENDVLLTAHQQDDQAETVLLQLLRGAGPKGLAAMPALKTLGIGFHGRPLLNITRAQLQQYARQNKLNWIDDESNTNQRFTRNYLRHAILPVLKQRFPSVTKTLARTASHCAETDALLDEVIALDLMRVRIDQYSLCIKTLLTLSSIRQRHLLRAFLSELRFPIPTTAKMRDIQERFLMAGNDRTPHVHWEQVELRRYQHRLYAMHCLPLHDSERTFQWDLVEPLFIPGIGQLENPGLRCTVAPVTVRFRQGGERCQLPGRVHRHSLKHLFQTWQIPPWLRERMPLIYLQDELIAIPGYFIHEAYKAETPIIA